MLVSYNDRAGYPDSQRIHACTNDIRARSTDVVCVVGVEKLSLGCDILRCTGDRVVVDKGAGAC